METIQIHRRIKPPLVRTAALYALYINVLIHLLFLVMFFYGRNAVLPVEGADHPRQPLTGFMLLFGALSTYIYLFMLFCVNFYVLKMEALSHRGRTVAAILVSVVLIVVWNRMAMAAQHGLFDLPRPDGRALRGGMVRDFIVGGLAVLSSQLIYANYRRQLMALENAALRAEYERARYEALKNQIDPHFLFNTLNTLNAVISGDPKKAQGYVQKLSSIFRYTTQSRDAATLEEELEFTKNYCELMRIRYGENLSFAFDISPRFNSCNLVPFSIQTLVENAVKHNVITNRQPLTVTVATCGDGYVAVSNPVNLRREQCTGEGIGLANLSERYMLRWGRDIEIRNDGDVFVVRVPLIPPRPELEDTAL